MKYESRRSIHYDNDFTALHTFTITTQRRCLSITSATTATITHRVCVCVEQAISLTVDVDM